MPNWCDNFVEVSHKNKEAIDRVEKAFNDARLCDEFLPVPAELKDSVADGSTNEVLIEKTGYSSWYDYCVNEWGTKWDVGGEDGGCGGRDSDTYVTLSFQSAWAPPTGLYDKLVDEGYEVRAYYYEPGCAFAGVYNNGSDECYSLDGNSESVKEEIPEELDEMFGITESMAEWEAENEED